MIIVIAEIRVKKGKAPEFIKGFKPWASQVRKERGCIEYFTAVDFQPKLPPQAIDENVVTILERWESIEALNEHLAAPAMQEHRESEKDLVEGRTIKVLQEA